MKIKNNLMHDNSKPIINKINRERLDMIRHCDNCQKEFHFSEVLKLYPISCHDLLKESWQRKEVEFYCSCCYFLKVLRFIKNKRNDGKRESTIKERKI